MNCIDARKQIDALVDSELPLDSSLLVEGHLSSCTECATIYRNRRRLSEAISDSEHYFLADEKLKSRISDALKFAGRYEIRPGFRNRYGTLTAFGAAACLLFFGFIGWRLGQKSLETSGVEQEVFESDMRSLMAQDHGVDVVSSDRHTVKPWFAGKLDFSPPVQDCSQEGFPLMGGRRDYVQGRVVAVLIYKRRQHWINVYIWPNDSPSELAATSERGYNIVDWTQNGMSYWAVSDLAGPELAQFAELLRRHP